MNNTIQVWLQNNLFGKHDTSTVSDAIFTMALALSHPLNIWLVRLSRCKTIVTELYNDAPFVILGGTVFGTFIADF